MFVHSIAFDVWYVLTILMSFSAIADVSGVAFSGRMAFCIINSLELNSQWGKKMLIRSPLRTNSCQRGHKVEQYETVEELYAYTSKVV